MYTNTQSLLAHKNEIQQLIMIEMKPAIIILSETRLTKNIGDGEMNVSGNKSVRCDSKNKGTGGVMIYVRNDIQFSTKFTEKLQLLVFKHNSDFIKFITDIVGLCTNIKCIVINNFNIDLHIDLYYANKLVTEMQYLRMRQYIRKPTRVMKNSRTLIDLVFSNDKIESKVIHIPRITDHSFIIIINIIQLDNFRIKSSKQFCKMY